VSLGIFDGLDNALWCYAFATVIFAGALAPFLPLLVVILLCGWAMLGVYVAVTSEKRLHIVSLDEQAVVILASIAGLLVVHMGDAAATPAGLATMLAIMALSSLAVALFFWVIGHYRLTRLLELMPYPVICGFMAGIGWLLLEAGVGVAIDAPISEFREAIAAPGTASRLLLFVAGAIGLLVAVTRLKRAWALPVASLLLVVVFYAVVWLKGFGLQELVAEGWLFDIPIDTGGALGLLQGLSFSLIDTEFVILMVPQILTIAFLALLTQSMSLSALMAAGTQDLDTSSEIEDMGAGNLLCAAIASPPGSTDVIASTLYEEFGASSRWMPLIASGVCLVMAVFGSAIIPWMPKLLVGSTVFLFAYQLFYEWLYENVRGFQPIDFAIVLFILGTVIFVGFMPGILVGILLALLLFVLRYSMISAVQGQHSLATYRSSVERSKSSNEILDEHGSECLVYNLRGFLFFGTANAHPAGHEAGHRHGHFGIEHLRADQGAVRALGRQADLLRGGVRNAGEPADAGGGNDGTWRAVAVSRGRLCRGVHGRRAARHPPVPGRVDDDLRPPQSHLQRPGQGAHPDRAHDPGRGRRE
jgi:SulP family sulfate permease